MIGAATARPWPQRAGERVRSIERALAEQLDRGEISAEQHQRLLRTLHGK